MDKIMLEFPLCCLAFQTTDRVKVGMIISYCIVENSKRKIYKKLAENDRLHRSGEDLGIKIGAIKDTKENHRDMINHIRNFEFKHEKDAYCRIGKNLCFETRDGQFPYRQFSILCAIQSIIGKRAKFKRVTKDRIRYASLGYKSKAIAQKEIQSNQILLTDRQIGTCIDILHAKKFFSKFTYAQRQTFFSTKLNDDQLYEAVKNSKIFWAKKKANIVDKQRSSEIHSELKIFRLNNTGRKYGNA